MDDSTLMASAFMLKMKAILTFKTGERNVCLEAVCPMLLPFSYAFDARIDLPKTTLIWSSSRDYTSTKSKIAMLLIEYLFKKREIGMQGPTS